MHNNEQRVRIYFLNILHLCIRLKSMRANIRVALETMRKHVVRSEGRYTAHKRRIVPIYVTVRRCVEISYVARYKSVQCICEQSSRIGSGGR